MSRGVFVDLTGQRFGLWSVVAPVQRTSSGEVVWATVCECGAESRVTGSNLRAGRSTRCTTCAARARRVRIAA